MSTFTLVLIGLISHLTLNTQNVSVLLTSSADPHNSRMIIEANAFAPGSPLPSGCTAGSTCIVDLAGKRVVFDPFGGQTSKMPSFGLILKTARVSRECKTLQPAVISRTVGGHFNSFVDYSGGWLQAMNVFPDKADMSNTDDKPPASRCIGCEVSLQAHRTDPVSFELIDSSGGQRITLLAGATVAIINHPAPGNNTKDHFKLHFEVFTDCDKKKLPQNKPSDPCNSDEKCGSGSLHSMSGMPSPMVYDVECSSSDWP